jgi:class 3 adenylate cyclase
MAAPDHRTGAASTDRRFALGRLTRPQAGDTLPTPEWATEDAFLPRHMPMLGLDVAGSTKRTDIGRLRMREQMYDTLDEALRTSGLGTKWEEDRVDRGDGAMILFKADVPKPLLLSKVVPALTHQLLSSNAYHSDIPMQLRVVVHAGEVHSDRRGYCGEALDLAFRLLNSGTLKRKLELAPGFLAVVVSESIYTSIVRHDYPGIDGAAFEQAVWVKVGTQRHRGWVHVPDLPTIPRQPDRRVTDLTVRRRVGRAD